MFGRKRPNISKAGRGKLLGGGGAEIKAGSIGEKEDKKEDFSNRET